PIEQADLRDRILHEIVPAYLMDNVKSRILQPDGTYIRQPRAESETPFRVQERLLGLRPATAANPAGENASATDANGNDANGSDVHNSDANGGKTNFADSSASTFADTTNGVFNAGDHNENLGGGNGSLRRDGRKRKKRSRRG
ncbi:MAG TPA: hypothetical protein VGJ15_09055, partial [Pirellulales bacterium]